MAQSNQEFTDFDLEMDLSGVEVWNGEDRPLVPIGDYVVTVENIEQKTSSTQKPMIVATLVIAEGELEGSKLWNNYVISPTTMGRLKALMVACGASLDKFRASECVGAKIMVSVTHNQGDPKIGPDGNPLPAKTFANIWNERPCEEAAPAKAAPPPPVTKTAKAAAPANGARRA